MNYRVQYAQFVFDHDPMQSSHRRRVASHCHKQTLQRYFRFLGGAKDPGPWISQGEASTFKEHGGSRSNTYDMPIKSKDIILWTYGLHICLSSALFSLSPSTNLPQFCLVEWKDFASRGSSRMA